MYVVDGDAARQCPSVTASITPSYDVVEASARSALSTSHTSMQPGACVIANGMRAAWIACEGHVYSAADPRVDVMSLVWVYVLYRYSVVLAVSRLLRRDAARPEACHLAVAHAHRVAVVRRADVRDA